MYDGVCYYSTHDVCVTAVFITLKSILVVDLLGLEKLTTAYGILSLLEGVGSLAGTPLIGELHSLIYCPHPLFVRDSLLPVFLSFANKQIRTTWMSFFLFPFTFYIADAWII